MQEDKVKVRMNMSHEVHYSKEVEMSRKDWERFKASGTSSECAEEMEGEVDWFGPEDGDGAEPPTAFSAWVIGPDGKRTDDGFEFD